MKQHTVSLQRLYHSTHVILLDDNARPHSQTKSLSLPLAKYPPNNPDLAPSDYLLFPHLKTYLAGYMTMMINSK